MVTKKWDLPPMIDDPEPFGPQALENWERYLKRIEALPQTVFTVPMIKRARRMIEPIRSNPT